MKKGDVLEGRVVRVDYPNHGLVEGPEGLVVVKNVIPGQVVRYEITKKRNGRGQGRLLSVVTPSEEENRQPSCSTFGECGGCLYQTMGVAGQLQMKEGQILRLLGEFLPENTWEGILGSPREVGYRNKMEFSFGDAVKGGPLTLGLHKRNSTYDVCVTGDCALVHPDMGKILLCVLEYCREKGYPHFHRVTHEGYLRHLLLRRGEAKGEILVHLITTSQRDEDFSPLTQRLLALPLEGKIVGILHLKNDLLADVVSAQESLLLYGRDYFEEELLGLTFRVSSFSFFQPNSLAAERLYTKVAEYASLALKELGEVEEAKEGEAKEAQEVGEVEVEETGKVEVEEAGAEETSKAPGGRLIYDLYCGTGTITQLLGKMAGEAVGVEIVEEAVLSARENAARNGVDQVSFLCGDVLKVLDELPRKPDVMVLDPPRDGIHPKALPKILSYGTRYIIYVSCKATSLARDLPFFLERGYQVQRACCVDQFVHTPHVETVVLMSRES